MSDHVDPVVLVAPAMAIGSQYYTRLTAGFERVGWTARALPRRGFEAGAPRASRTHDWSYGDEIGDIADAVAQARSLEPARPVLILGHSLGGQLAVGHQLTCDPADGIITVGACVPHYRHYRFGGVHVAAMGCLAVPALTAACGYLPRPAFGGPGARTLMREWARMARTGRTPFTAVEPIATPSLLISMHDDTLAPKRGVDDLARRFFEPKCVVREHLRPDDVPEGVSNDHIAWARTPSAVVDRTVAWWTTRAVRRRSEECGVHPN